MERTVFNNAQLEIRDILSHYFAEKAQKEIDKLLEGRDRARRDKRMAKNKLRDTLCTLW